MRYFLIPICLITFMSCSEDSNSSQGAAHSNYPQVDLLNRYADSLIIPSLEKSVSEINTLRNAWIGFKNKTKTIPTLRSTLKSTILQWIEASPYSFGPAEDRGLVSKAYQDISTFPVDTIRINEYIKQGITTHPKYIRLDYMAPKFKGLFALEYLFYKKHTFDTNTTELIDSIVNHIHRKITSVHSQWKSGYKQTFVKHTGIAIGSSINNLYNEWVLNYEHIKNFKAYIPSRDGVRYVESYYGGHSLEYLKKSLDINRKIFNGGHSKHQKLSLRQYVMSVTNGDKLVETIDAKWQEIQTKLSELDSSKTWRQLLAEKNKAALDLVKLLTGFTRYIKTDMASLMGFSITFNSNDGD